MLVLEIILLHINFLKAKDELDGLRMSSLEGATQQWERTLGTFPTSLIVRVTGGTVLFSETFALFV